MPQGRCAEHGQSNCYRSHPYGYAGTMRNPRYGSTDNAGSIGVDTDGDLTVGIGGGLGIDTSDGSLEIEVFPGVYVDTDGD